VGRGENNERVEGKTDQEGKTKEKHRRNEKGEEEETYEGTHIFSWCSFHPLWVPSMLQETSPFLKMAH
jgi:hypothetical protein